jgi:translation initiation factor 3 subunit E
MGKKAAPQKSVEEEEPRAKAEAADAAQPPAREQLTAEQAKEMAKYDLIHKMTPFLDRHLIFPILNFAQETGVFKSKDLTRVELNLLSDTSMIDFAIDKYEAIGEKAPESLTDRRQTVLEDLSSCRDHVLPLLEILEDDDKVKRIPNFKTLDELCSDIDFDIDPDVVDALTRYARMQFDCGNYALSAELLKHYRSMPQGETMTSKHVSCLWGSVASALLNREFEEAAELILKLDQYLEDSKSKKSEVLIHRTWLLHWTLFAIFSADKVDPKLLEFFLNEKSLSIISLSCPHLFRYVGAVLILQKRLKHLVKDTVWIIHHEAASYADPVTRFLLALYADVDYDDAQQELQRCEQVCRGDFFLAAHWNDFQENARLHIFEAYCRIHQFINIQMIASKLNMEAEEAELWIVKLIQNAKLDARIDSEKSRVVMTKARPDVYQQVIEKTKNLAFRSTMLVSNMEQEVRRQ